MKNTFDIYEMITKLIIERLETGVIPWQMPWKSGVGTPQNMIYRKAYRGLNFWYLLTVVDQLGSPFFLTFKQVKELGGHVRKGEKGFPVVFWKIHEKEEKDGEIKQIPILRYYKVFNVTQVDGIEESSIPSVEAHDHEFDSIDEAERLVKYWGDCPEIKFDQSRAFYNPSLDFVGMPNPRTFFKDEQYYSTLFHELVHSTGHSSRLNRHEKLSDHRFASKDYSKEELVAEMGAAYLCGITGIGNDTIDNSAAYIKSWIRKFQEDKKILIRAASQAQKAVDCMMDHYEERL